MTVRPARDADLAMLAAIEVSAATRFLGTPMAFVVGHPPTPVAVLAAAMARGGLWLAVDADDLPLGFLHAEAIEGWLYIREVSVRAEAQGRGAGRELIDAARAAARGLGCDCLSLTTDRALAWNGPWYARLGFVEVAALPGWLAAILVEEGAMGLDPARRCAMVLRF